ncbi:MAG: DUF1565 domain-containing protein [Pseudomonadota bacterium]
MKALLLVLLSLGLILQQQPAMAGVTYPVLYVLANGSADPYPLDCGTSTSTPCRKIASAVTLAKDYATTTIKVAQGNYTENIHITETLPVSLSAQLAIEGGWNADFTAQSHDPSLTRVTSSTDNPILNMSIGGLGSVDLRLAYFTFQGLTDSQRQGFAVSANSSTIGLVVDHCQLVSFRGQAISLYADNNSAMTVTVNDTLIEGNFQWPIDTPWPGAGVSANSYALSTLNLTMTKNKIMGNLGSSGGGLSLNVSGAGSSLNAVLENNILAGNQAIVEGGAILATTADSAEMELHMTILPSAIIRRPPRRMASPYSQLAAQPSPLI